MKNLFFTPIHSSKKAGVRWLWVLLLVGMLSAHNCKYDTVEEPVEYRDATKIALAWNHLALDLERNTLGYRPPVSARMFAYVEMAAYEASLPGLRNYISMDHYVTGYENPNVKFGEGQFYLPASLNAAYAQILRNFFPTTSTGLQQQIDLLEKEYAQSFLQKTNSTVLDSSAAFGKAVAGKVWGWSKTDREGNYGYLYNYDHGYEPPSCPGCWQPTGEHPMPALLPYWGRVRPFMAGHHSRILRSSGFLCLRVSIQYKLPSLRCKTGSQALLHNPQDF